MNRFIKKALLAAAFLISCTLVQAQNMSDMIVSEIVAENDSTGLCDEYGQREGWIELFNTSKGTVNIAGCFISDDRANLKKSILPKGDLRTKIGPRQSAILFASGDAERGTFHLGFELKKGSTIYLTSNDGRTIIDSLVIPATIAAGQSIAKVATDIKEMKFDETKILKPSPYAQNGKTGTLTKAQKIAESDPHGVILSITAVSVVFSALFILFCIYTVSGAFFSGKIKLKREPKPKKSKEAVKGEVSPEVAAAIAMALDKEYGSEVYAAIGLALHEYLSNAIHDQESMVITIKPTENTGWTNKSLNFRKRP
ncbi:MAG: OadG family protein [Bacteroidales bacterium]|nr:OadG family protein [Bacteroidales bacterium]